MLFAKRVKTVMLSLYLIPTIAVFTMNVLASLQCWCHVQMVSTSTPGSMFVTGLSILAVKKEKVTDYGTNPFLLFIVGNKKKTWKLNLPENILFSFKSFLILFPVTSDTKLFAFAVYISVKNICNPKPPYLNILAPDYEPTHTTVATPHNWYWTLYKNFSNPPPSMV